jgi:heptosyltransferase II
MVKEDFQMSERGGSRVPVAVRLPNWVGDVCMTLPTLSKLQDNELDLHLYGKPWAVDLLAGMPYITRALPGGVISGAKVIKASGCRYGLLFTNSFTSAAQMSVAGISAVGYGKECRSFLLSKSVAPEAGLHEVQSYWKVGRALLARHMYTTTVAKNPPPSMDLTLAPRHLTEADVAVRSGNVPRNYTVLCPLATGKINGASKIWPSFPVFCRLLREKGHTVVACPGPGEEEATARALPGAIILRDVGLGAFAAIMSQARVVVANDSGPMHLAAAVSAPVLGIFGVSDPNRTRPWSKNARIIGDGKSWPSMDAVWDMVKER